MGSTSVLVYNFSYENINLRKNSLRILFPEDESVFFYINPLNTLDRNIRHNNVSRSLERISNNQFITHTGLLIDINNSGVKITFLDNGSTLETNGDGSSTLNYTVDFRYISDDRDFLLNPTILKGGSTFASYFKDVMNFSNLDFVKIDESDSPFLSNFDMDRISIFKDLDIGEVFGSNNQFNIVNTEINEVLVPMIPNYERSNLDNIFF